MKVVRALGVAVALIGTSLACSDPVSTPTAASNASPFAINITGLYGGTSVLTNVLGGECVGADLGRSVGAVDLNTVTISQQQSDVTAVVRSATTGARCSYAGTSRSAVFAVDTTSCSAETFYQCSNGQSRILKPVGSTITGTVLGETATGTIATSYNVYREASDGTRIAVAGLTTQERFDAARR